MKLKINTTTATKTEPPKKERKNALKGEGTKVCFYTGDSLDKLDKLNALLKKAGSTRVTQSFIFREGAKELIETLLVKARKASEGTLHAKKR